MSFERAYVNCQRCYGLAEPTRKGNSPLEKDLWATKVEEKAAAIHEARNQAMIALEGVYEGPLQIYTLDERAAAKQALQACAGCDFSKPEIAKKILGMEVKE